MFLFGEEPLLFLPRPLYCGLSGTVACSNMRLAHFLKWSALRGKLIEDRAPIHVQCTR